MTTIRRIMKTAFVAAEAHDTVMDVVQRMSDQHAGAALLIHEGKLAGLFTERDLLNRVVRAGRDAARTRIDEVATPRPRTTSPDEDVDSCCRALSNQGFRHLPVVDADNRPLGTVSVDDLMRSNDLPAPLFAFPEGTANDALAEYVEQLR